MWYATYQIRCIIAYNGSNKSELMHFDELTTDAAVLAELGRRLERHRLERNWTQAEMAAEAGIGQATVQRAERGQSVQMTSMIKLLRTLGLLAGLDLAIPESIDLPIAQLDRQQRNIRRRARGRRGGRAAEPTEPDEEPWRWGNQPGSGL
jgi:transcriptional regulator with XRE-family HTH domain